MEKMTGKSMDLIAENIAQLKTLFPEAVTEGKIDFEVLKVLLGGEIEKRQTYYKFTWNGKEEARAYARIPSMGTLRPCVSESSGKDGKPGKFDSENLYIEGDNLEVLKLLQGPYHKRVKMIYIDPPYNTGHDFVYPDNFRDSISNYKALTGQIDSEGNATKANSETSGRYHTDWLNMIYPRLILARNLLAEDGAIFISIDDSEAANLRKVCDDVFGEENFIADIRWKGRGGRQDSKYFAVIHEDILCYARNIDMFHAGEELKEEGVFPKFDEEKKRFYKTQLLRKWGSNSLRENRPNLYYPIKGPDGSDVFPMIFEENSQVDGVSTPATCNEIAGRWRWGASNMAKKIEDGFVEFAKNKFGKWVAYEKIYAPTEDDLPTKKYTTWVDYISNGTQSIKDIFGTVVFEYPKSPELISHFLKMGDTEDGSIVLDFFSGSATTAHAVLQQNLEDKSNRKYILVQLPEVCEKGTEAAKAGYKNICEIGKERIRRAAKKIKEENPLFAGDMGFKVFKLDTSNMVPWNPKAEELQQSLIDAVDNVLADRSTEDLLYEVLLKCNLPLTLPIAERKFGENTVYIVGEGALAICLDTKIPQTIAEEIVKLRDEYAPIVPMQVVFRDNGFTDVAKTNALQILKQAGFEEKSVQTI